MAIVWFSRSPQLTSVAICIWTQYVLAISFLASPGLTRRRNCLRAICLTVSGLSESTASAFFFGQTAQFWPDFQVIFPQAPLFMRYSHCDFSPDWRKRRSFRATVASWPHGFLHLSVDAHRQFSIHRSISHWCCSRQSWDGSFEPGDGSNASGLQEQSGLRLLLFGSNRSMESRLTHE